MAQQASDRLVQLSKPSACVDRSEWYEAAVACEAGKEVLRRGAAQLVVDAAGVPILSSKSCGGTPICVVHRSKKVLPSG